MCSNSTMGSKKKKVRKWNMSKAWKCSDDDVSSESDIGEVSCDV